MESIYDQATLQGIFNRIDTLKPDSQRQWGKMDVAQMLAHCSNSLEVALGDKLPKGGFMAKLLGPFIKSVIVSEKPFKQSLPTDPSFVVADTREFSKEKDHLKTLLTRISTGRDAMQNKKHPLFGKMTADEWSISQVKHMDHHLRQFGA